MIEFWKLVQDRLFALLIGNLGQRFGKFLQDRRVFRARCNGNGRADVWNGALGIEDIADGLFRRAFEARHIQPIA